MKKNPPVHPSLPTVDRHFFEHFWEESWTYIKTVVDVVHEPVLILNKDLKVMAANESFYRTFQVDLPETEGRNVYSLGNGQWNIPALRKLLEDILPQNSFFKGFTVDHDFPVIGHKVMILNARHIHFKRDTPSELFPAIIMLAMEDVTDMFSTATDLSEHMKTIEVVLSERTTKLEEYTKRLESEISLLKKKKASDANV